MLNARWDDPSEGIEHLPRGCIRGEVEVRRALAKDQVSYRATDKVELESGRTEAAYEGEHVIGETRRYSFEPNAVHDIIIAKAEKKTQPEPGLFCARGAY